MFLEITNFVRRPALAIFICVILVTSNIIWISEGEKNSNTSNTNSKSSWMEKLLSSIRALGKISSDPNHGTQHVHVSATERICNETNRIFNTVYNRESASNHSEAINWEQDVPILALNCEQLARSIPIHILDEDEGIRQSNRNIQKGIKDATTATSTSTAINTAIFDLSLQRLAIKLQKLEQIQTSTRKKNGDNNTPRKLPLKIAVIGGSMTTGYHDIGTHKTNAIESAWPRKLEKFMNEKWLGLGVPPVQVINLAQGGANEKYWLGTLDFIMNHNKAPFDVILVESAVNDACDHRDQYERLKEVNQTSHMLLNILMNFPGDPAVLNVEAFSVANTNRTNARKHCKGHEERVNITNATYGKCIYCPQWWKPQDWRKEAREQNSVSYISFRDAVWPILDQPPENLCYQWWHGLSHPQSGTHALIASTILFQFMVVMHHKDHLLEVHKESKRAGRDKVKIVAVPSMVCLEPISIYRSLQNNSHDPMDFEKDNVDYNKIMHSTCWEFRADSKEKYGWICEYSRNITAVPERRRIRIRSNESESVYTPSSSTSRHKRGTTQQYLHFRKKIRIGKDGKVTVTRLVSYDKRMATAQVWFSNVNHPLSKNITDQYEAGNDNIFIGDLVWNITSWHRHRNSIPQPEVIELGELEFKLTSGINSSFGNSNITHSSSLEVMFNIKMLAGSSVATLNNRDSGIDKFKLLGVVSC